MSDATRVRRQVGLAASGKRNFAKAVVAREVLCDAARVLEAHGIAVMPLKGVLFQLLLYRDPAERTISDVDVLVHERDFEAAITALTAAGFGVEKAGRSLIEVALRSPRGLSLDLHRQLFSHARYRLDTGAVFQRATRDEALLGVALYLAHPHDTAAHLIGKFVSDHECFDPGQRLAELAAWVHHCSIDPVRLGQHLGRCGMGRAGRYVFSRGAELLDDPFFAAALAGLPNDRAGKLLARVARALMPQLASSPVGALPAHLLNASLASAGLSMTLTLAQRLRHAWLRRQQGRAGGYWAPFFAPVSGRRADDAEYR